MHCWYCSTVAVHVGGTVRVEVIFNYNGERVIIWFYMNSMGAASRFN